MPIPNPSGMARPARTLSYSAVDEESLLLLDKPPTPLKPSLPPPKPRALLKASATNFACPTPSVPPPKPQALLRASAANFSCPTPSALVFGLLNSIMCIPTLYGYASIIFAAPVYRDFLPALSKLVLLSSVVHQLVFSGLSTLPFAIGQVQDAGLLFLSKMASIIAHELRGADDPAVAVSTCIALLGLSTSLTGAALILLGKLR